jgi:hypothetical protein
MMSDREKSIASDESLCNQQQQQHQQHYEDYDSVDTFADNEPSAPVRDNNHTNSKSTSVGSVRPVSVSVLEEMKEGLALSMLAFLAADLRLMSATGRIATKYETVAVESDFVIRNNRESCAVLMNNNQEESSRQQQEAAAAAAARIPEHVRQGLSPAQLMAVVLIEMKKTFEQQQRQDVIIKNLKRQSGNRQPEAATAFTAFLMDHKKDKNNWEDDLNTLMKAYAQMIGADLDEKVPHIDARRSMLNLMNFATLDQQNAPGSNNTTLTDTNNNNNGESSTSSRRVVTLPSRQAIMANMDYHRKELFDSRNTKEFRQMEAVTDALFNMAAGATDGREHNRRLRQSIQHMQLSTGSSIQSTITSDGQPEQRHATTNNHHNHNPSLSSDDLLAFMEKAVESRKDANLEFMSNFFRAGTVSQVMITSNVRVVWINDWFSQLDLIYAIAVDADQRRVLVIFRGAITRHDWAKAFEYTPARVENPVRDEYEGRTDHIGIHKGFYQYLFRVRKDTGTTKYEEIVNVAHRYGMERIGEGYTLAVTGHSLGAALSTVFAFQASTDERFTRNGPIKIMTFGCPYIGKSSNFRCGAMPVRLVSV